MLANKRHEYNISVQNLYYYSTHFNYRGFIKESIQQRHFNSYKTNQGQYIFHIWDYFFVFQYICLNCTNTCIPSNENNMHRIFIKVMTDANVFVSQNQRPRDLNYINFTFPGWESANLTVCEYLKVDTSVWFLLTLRTKRKAKQLVFYFRKKDQSHIWPSS